MNRRWMVAGFTVVVSAASAFGQENPALRSLALEYWEARLERNPTYATSLGDYRFNDQLDDLSPQGYERWRKRLVTLQHHVRELKTDGFSADDQLTHALLDRVVGDELLSLSNELHQMPMEPLEGPHLRLPLLLVSQPFRDAADFRAYIKRLEAFPKQVDGLITAMDQGIARRWVSPRVIINKVIPQIRDLVVDDPTASELYKPAARLKDLPEEQRAELELALRKAVEAAVIPAYRKLETYLTETYYPKTPEAVGIGALSGGMAAYDKLIYLHMTRRATAKDVHELGLAEVARLRDAMDAVRVEMKFDKPLDAFLWHMRTDPRYRFSSGQELYNAADAHLQRAKSQMPKLFGRLPKADCVMKEIEAFRAPAAPVAYYNAPPEDGSRPAYYYINVYKPEERLRFTLEALTYHEAVPGHHLQIALHQEMKDLPAFRRYASFTAFLEGWALYTEKLAYEIGGYQTPEDRFGQLTFEMWRACRLVVDTGMHAMGWTREKAIEFMAKNTSLAMHDIESEIDRYISWPGQALAYKTGAIRVEKMRRDAEAALGDSFNVRDFHDAMLSGGAMPIDMLETRMAAWTAGRKNQNRP